MQALLQTAIPAVPLPDAQSIGFALLWFLAGLTVPTRYGIERVEGFGRLVASKLPYAPPPGSDKQTAMVEATDTDQNVIETQAGDDEGQPRDENGNFASKEA